MVAGSDSYVSGHNNVPSLIPQYYPASPEDVSLSYNADHLYPGSPYFVRKSGVYILFFIVNAEQSSQFCVYVNGIEQPLTRSGNNTGSGQLILRCMLKLLENDNVLVRNADSSVGAVTSNLRLGGLLDGNNLTCVIMKIAPYEAQPKCNWDEKCLSRRKKHLFKKLMDKMLVDKELMISGFTTHGTIWNVSSQTVAVESDVVWTNTTNLSNVTWNISSPTNVVINEDGVYKIFFYANVMTAAQVAVTVNNVPVVYTIQGTNKGASYLSIRVLQELRAGDVITIRNHTSATPVTFASNAGGFNSAVSTILTIFKIAPLTKPDMCEVEINKYHKRCYKLFKKYLLNQDCLQIEGSAAYLSATASVIQTVSVNQNFDWTTIAQKHNVKYRQGDTEFTVMVDGVYDIFTDIITDEPQQMCLFINGIPDATTQTGRESGGGRSIMRQFVSLYKGDVVEVRNYTSLLGDVTTSVNPGGILPGQNASILLFRLSPILPCLPAPCVNNNSQPQNSKSADSKSADKSANSKSADSKSKDAKPADSKSKDAKQADSKSKDAKSADSKAQSSKNSKV
jgi:hypothetical protein